MSLYPQIVECMDQLRRRAEESLRATKPKSHHRYQVTCENAVCVVEGCTAMEVIVVLRVKKSGNVVGEEIITRSEGPNFFDVCVGTLNALDAELKDWRVSTAKRELKAAIAKIESAGAEKKTRPFQDKIREMLAKQVAEKAAARGGMGDDDAILVWYDNDGIPHEIPMPRGCYLSFAKESECSKPN